MTFHRAVNEHGPWVYIVRGAFEGRRAAIERDYGSHARLYLANCVLNLPESHFLRLPVVPRGREAHA